MALNVSSKFLDEWYFAKNHRGCTVRDYVFKVVDTIQPRNIYIMGHSFGGALASLCAFDIKYHNPNTDPIIYTLGSPRVGEAGFQYHFGKLINKSYRVLDIKDPIPNYPSEYEGFKHVKEGVVIDGDLQMCNINMELPIDQPTDFNKHNILSYIQTLQTMISNSVNCVNNGKWSYPFKDCINSVGPSFGRDRCIY